MQRPPEIIKGIRFDEAFFDACLIKAGAYRTCDKHTPPPNMRHVDYIFEDYAIELKILMIEPLESRERQARIFQFIREEFPRGPLNITASRKEIRLTGHLMVKFWSRIVGQPIQRAFEDAVGQIEDTKSFVRPNLKGAVLIVNAAAESIDASSFCNLANTYRARFPQIEVVFAFNGIPYPIGKSLGSPALIFARLPDSPAIDPIYSAIGDSIRTEIEKRTGSKSKTVELTLGELTHKPIFTVTPDGRFVQKNSIKRDSNSG